MGYVPTTNYGFQKPEKTNSFNVDDLNNALDKVDETFKNLDDEINTKLIEIKDKNTEQDTKIRNNDIDSVVLEFTNGNLSVELNKVGGGKVDDSVTLPFNKTFHTATSISQVFSVSGSYMVALYDLVIEVYRNSTSSGNYGMHGRGRVFKGEKFKIGNEKNSTPIISIMYDGGNPDSRDLAGYLYFSNSDTISSPRNDFTSLTSTISYSSTAQLMIMYLN